MPIDFTEILALLFIETLALLLAWVALLSALMPVDFTETLALPPTWVALLSVLIPLVPAGLVHPSSDANGIRWLIAAGISALLAVVEQIMAESFTIQNLLVTFITSVVVFLTSHDALKHLKVNDRVLPSKGFMASGEGHKFT